jgi:hypothetical protein
LIPSVDHRLQKAFSIGTRSRPSFIRHRMHH